MSFIKTEKKRTNSVLPTPDTLDVDKINIGEKKQYTGAPGEFVPMSYKNGPLSFQARGLFVPYAGTMTAKNQRDNTDVLDRSYGIMVDVGNEECKYLSGNKNDAKELKKFTQNLEDKIEQLKNEKNKNGKYENAEKLGCTYKKEKKSNGEKINKIKLKELKSLVSEGSPKLDKETGKETGEVYNPSIKFPLRLARDKNTKQKIDAFTTEFVDEKGKKLNIKPSNIDGQIPYGTYVILNINYARAWLGKTEYKITPYVNKAILLLPKKVAPPQEMDNFITSDDENENENENEKNNDDNNENNNESDNEDKIQNELNELLSDDEDLSI
jgi:hypothetical protein